MNRNRNIQRGFGLSLATLALVVACTDSTQRPAITDPSAPTGPNLAASVPFNNEGACLASDAYVSGLQPDTRAGTPGVNDPLDLADPEKSCTSNDIRIATTTLNSFSFNGVDFTPFTGQNVTCVEGQPIFLNVNALVDETATSERTDIGIWIATDGGNARTGTCNHYNLVNSTVSNIDNDLCGDMNNAEDVNVPLGVIDAVCQTSGAVNSTTLHIGSCLAWTEPGNDRVCPLPSQGPTPDGFRWGTVPGATSKCNCEGFDVPITVLKVAQIQLVKSCTPANDPGTFDLNIDGSTSNTSGTFGEDKACGTNTGLQTVGAGTNVTPGADHTVSESGFSIAASNYTSTVSCTKNGAAYIASQAYTAGTNLTVHTDPNDVVICTFVNVRKSAITIIKDAVPNGPTDFDFTTTGTGLSSFSLDDDGDNANTLSNTKTFTGLTPGAYSVTEAAAAGFDLTSLTCNDAASATPSTGNTGTRTATINVEAGETVTCTFTNTQRGSIIIEKQTIPDGASGSFTFTQNVDGTGNFSLSDNGTKTFLNVAPGPYTVTESNPGPSFALTALVCTDPTTNSTVNVGTRTATINLAAGETVTCVYTNTQQARVRVVKTLSGAAISGSETFTFTLRTGASSTLSGTTLETLVANSTNGGTLNFTTFLTPGSTYQICEVVLPGWNSSISSLTGAFTIQTEPDGDNSTICAPFTPTAGQTVILNIDNTPPPGGLARTIGFWKNWSSCSNSNGKQAPVLDQTLVAAGGSILIGDLVVNTCEEAVAILNKSDIGTGKKMASDPAYNLAAQLLAARLNVVAGAGTCPAATTAMTAAQILLAAIDFDGTGGFKSTMTAQQISDANSLAATLDSYNNNTLCPAP